MAATLCPPEVSELVESLVATPFTRATGEPKSTLSIWNRTVPPGVPVLLRDLIHAHTGIFFEPGRFDTMLEKLRDRAPSRGPPGSIGAAFAFL